jgi:hypothetical protein
MSHGAQPASAAAENIIDPIMENKKDQKRLRKQIADADEVRSTTDEILTDENTNDLPMEDEHEKLPHDE